jgi:hypothetical protein
MRSCPCSSVSCPWLIRHWQLALLITLGWIPLGCLRPLSAVVSLPAETCDRLISGRPLVELQAAHGSEPSLCA